MEQFYIYPRVSLYFGCRYRGEREREKESEKERMIKEWTGKGDEGGVEKRNEIHGDSFYLLYEIGV